MKLNFTIFSPEVIRKIIAIKKIGNLADLFEQFILDYPID